MLAIAGVRRVTTALTIIAAVFCGRSILAHVPTFFLRFLTAAMRNARAAGALIDSETTFSPATRARHREGSPRDVYESGKKKREKEGEGKWNEKTHSRSNSAVRFSWHARAREKER